MDTRTSAITASRGIRHRMPGSRDALHLRALLFALGRSLLANTLASAGCPARVPPLHLRRRHRGAGMDVYSGVDMAEWWVIAAIGCALLSGIPGAMMSRASRAGERIATALMLLGGLFGVAGSVCAILSPSPAGITLPWAVPGGALSVRVDGISAMFVIQIF